MSQILICCASFYIDQVSRIKLQMFTALHWNYERTWISTQAHRKNLQNWHFVILQRKNMSVTP